ncbi:hypothetical protein Dolphis_92 [Pseudomonas phage Dolphis]|nr:hypothetical protein Dolphis_92 [Pseudomonas phage Dolphis]
MLTDATLMAMAESMERGEFTIEYPEGEQYGVGDGIAMVPKQPPRILFCNTPASHLGHELKALFDELAQLREQVNAERVGALEWLNDMAKDEIRRLRQQNPKPYTFEPVPGATCTRELQAAGKPYPRTCQVHGLTCGVKQP